MLYRLFAFFFFSFLFLRYRVCCNAFSLSFFFSFPSLLVDLLYRFFFVFCYNFCFFFSLFFAFLFFVIGCVLSFGSVEDGLWYRYDTFVEEILRARRFVCLDDVGDGVKRRSGGLSIPTLSCAAVGAFQRCQLFDSRPCHVIRPPASGGIYDRESTLFFNFGSFNSDPRWVLSPQGRPFPAGSVQHLSALSLLLFIVSWFSFLLLSPSSLLLVCLPCLSLSSIRCC